MLRAISTVALAALVVETLAECHDLECSDHVVIGEGDAGSLLQVRSQSACGSQPDDCPYGHPVSIGVIKTVFHNVTGWVYALAMEQLGVEYKVVDKYGHYQLYPMFTGQGKPDGCEEEGCADLCKAQGLGDKSPCIDLLVDSQTPGYHQGFTYPVKGDWRMAGTAFDHWLQTLWVPQYSEVRTLDEAAKSSELIKTIYTFPPGEDGGGCEAMFCPACPNAPGVNLTASFPYMYSPPLSTAGYKVKTLKCPEYKKKINKMLKKKVGFLTYNWELSPFQAWFGHEWRPLQLEQYRNQAYPVPRVGAPNIASPGKALLRKKSAHKFTEQALGVIAGIYIGNAGVKEMCGWALDDRKSHRLCDSVSWSTACAREAAHKWIQQNNYSGDISNGITPSSFGVWPSFFW